MSDENAPQPPALPRAKPVPPGDGYFERLAAPLPARVEPKEPVPEGHELIGESAAEREARRAQAMLGAGYMPESGAAMTFDPRIAYALALEIDKPSAIFTKYGVSIERARELMNSPFFVNTIKRYKEELHASGISFRLKAKIQAEDLLTHSYLLAVDPETPAAVRADMIKWTAKMADLEPDSKKEGGGGAGGAAFSLNITFAGMPGQPEPRVVQGQHTIIDDKKEGT